MDQDRFEKYLVDKAKELLHEDLDTNPAAQRNREHIETAQNGPGDDRGPDSIDRPNGFNSDEIEMLTKNRASMSNDELRSFLEQDTPFHEDLEAAEDTSFQHWEERIMIQSHTDESVEAIAEELGRDPATVRVHMRKLGLDLNDDDDDIIATGISGSPRQP